MVGSRFLRYLYSVLIVILATVLSSLVHSYLPLSPTNLVMIYLLAIVLAAVYIGRGPAILASVLGVLAFDFFFVPPRFTMTVDDTEYLLTFVAFLLVGLIISYLATQARQADLLKATEQLQNALLDSISHDLRTPLASITGALSALDEQGETLTEESRRNLVELAREQADGLNHLVGNLLEMARIEAGALRIHREMTDVQDLIGSAIRQIEDRHASRRIDVDIPADIPLVPMDFVQILHALIYLLDNAIKYSPENTPVNVEVEPHGTEIFISVLDRGFGIPPDDLQRVFNKFYRTQRPDQISGTGLGLAISKGLVEAHGGRIWAANRAQGGTRVTIALPLVVDELNP